jgi:hypothetical protein
MIQGALTVICTYRVKKRREKEFLDLLRRHWRTLHRLGLTTAEPSRIYRGEEGRGHPYFVEIFGWRNARAVAHAHQYADVAAVWEPMEKLCEARAGRPAMEFPHVTPVKLGRGR